ncbi:MAG: phospho-sugar mutase, partial [Clostridia bacterium]|nr:phospho-sugar mutase [Clostridia bacterium]
MYNSYAHWKYNTDIDESLADADSFSGELSFGTSGIRGVMGIGPKRMNEYVVARACKAVAMQLISDGEQSVAITYDSRNNSYFFARLAAEVFAANKIKVYITEQLAPTPVLAYVVGQLKCGGGIVITASHNPKQYNGLKVFDKAGCQISGKYAEQIATKIKSMDYFNIIKADFDTESALNNIQYIPENIFADYLCEVKKQGYNNCDNVKVCYTPLNGSGGIFVPQLLREKGADVLCVEEQAYPDGNFTTCPYPNPEAKEAYILAEKYAMESGSDIIIANDPDADRIGVMYFDKEKYVLLSGDEIGLVICEYLLRQKSRVKNIKGNIIVRSVVTMRLIDKIAQS